MSHFAKINSSGIVENVIVAEQSYVDTLSGTYVQTSYNTKRGKHYQLDGTLSSDQSKALRKNYARIGGTYDSVRGAFFGKRPFDSWVIDEDTCTFVKPSYGSSEYVYWDETNKTWVKCDPPNVEISRFKFMLNLKGITLADSSNAYTTAVSKSSSSAFSNDRVQTMWDHSVTFKRLSNDVKTFASDIGLTDTQLDTLFEITDYNSTDTTRSDE